MGRNKNSCCFVGCLSLAFIVATALTTHAQADPKPKPSPPPLLEREFVKNILSDQKEIWTAPVRLERGEAKWIVPSSIGFMALATTDRITGDRMARFHRQLKASRIVSYAGSVYGAGAISGTFYLFGRMKNNDRARETGLLSAEALINGLIVESALKEVTQRARPLAGSERSEFFDGGNSFPSGHSTQAWAVATIIAREYQGNRAIQIAAYGTAAAVSVARFTGQKHYISDALAGSALGYAIGKYVYNARHRKSLDTTSDSGPETQSRWPAITPQFSRGEHAYGISLRWSF